MSHLLAVLDSAVLTTQCHYIGNYGGQSTVLMTQCHYIGNSGGQSAIITTQCHDIGDSCGQIVIFSPGPWGSGLGLGSSCQHLDSDGG